MAPDAVYEGPEPIDPVEEFEVQDRIVGLIEVSTDDIYDHPHQWRVHSKNQIRTLREALRRVGQANVLIVYYCQKDLKYKDGTAIPKGSAVAIDGHGRKNQSGVKKWKALLLDVNDEEAAFLLATLDPISAMAVIDKERWAALYDALPVSGESTQMMFDGLLGTRMPAASVQYKGGGLLEDDSEDVNAAVDAETAAIPVSTVRMVQLYLNNETQPEYMDWMDTLGDYFETTSITDTTIAAVRWAYLSVMAAEQRREQAATTQAIVQAAVTEHEKDYSRAAAELPF